MKRRNPADLTGRNNNARKKEHAALKKRVAKLEIIIREIFKEALRKK